MIFTIPDTDIQIDIAPDLLQYLIAWGVAGAPQPAPDIIKKMTLLQYAKVFGAASFIETGTFRGTTTYLMAHYGLQCKSIELAEPLYNDAVQFLSGFPHVELFHGDSAERLGTMVSRAQAPHLFWLDGHYSKGDTARGGSDTPIVRELEQLLDHDMSRSVILIDDVRDFGQGDYPPLAELQAFVAAHWPDHIWENYGDIVRITPRATLAGRLQADAVRQAA